MLEVVQRGDLRDQRLEGRAGPLALDGQYAEVRRDLVHGHLERADVLQQEGQVRLGGREQEVVGRVPEHHAVLEDEAAVVAPHRVLRPPRAAGADVTGEDPAEEPLRVSTGDRVLVQR